MTLRYRNLVQAALSGQDTPNCPVLMWKHHPERDQDACALAAATVEFQDLFDCDIVKISPASTYQLKDHGLEDAWRGDPIGRRAVVRTVIDTADDWRRLAEIDPLQGFTGEFVACAKIVRRHFPASVPVIITVFNPMFQAAMLAGMDRLGEHLRDAPDAVQEGLDRLLDNTLALIESLAAAGVDGVFFASQQAQTSMLPVNVYAEYGLPGDLACLSLARSALPLNMLHLHGVGVHADLFSDLTDVVLHYELDAESPRPEVLLSQGRPVSTGPGPGLLAANPPTARIDEACASVLDRCQGRGFILSPGCSVRLATEPASLHAITRAARPS